METIIGQSGNGAPAADVIKDSNTEQFVDDVINASMEVPVLVDFWAPWCGPCKQLGPMLEKLVRAADGKVKLVKVNIDDDPVIAQQLRIQSIPAVFAFHKGQPVDGFVGALPESQLKAFIERLTGSAVGPTPVDQALEAGKAALEAGEIGEAQAAFTTVLGAEPDNAAALAGLARCQIAGGDLAGARETLERAGPAQANHPEIAGAKAALTLAEETGDSGDAEEAAALRARLEQNPNDHETRFELAKSLLGANMREAAVEELLDIVRRDRKWNDEAARKQLLTLFEAWGPTDPLTVDARRRLSSLLFS